MGKSFAGVFANWSGKVGNVVGRIRQGRTIMSIYQPQVHNPKTDSQELAREKFRLLSKFIGSITGFVKVSFRNLDGYKTGTPNSAAIGYNFKADPTPFVTDTPGEVELDYTKCKVSQGSVDLPYSPSASAEGNSVTITWSDNSGMGNAQATDQIMVLVYNPAKNQCVYNTKIADRSERNATLALPTAWSGDTVNCWLAVQNPKTLACSDSTHLAALPL